MADRKTLSEFCRTDREFTTDDSHSGRMHETEPEPTGDVPVRLVSDGGHAHDDHDSHDHHHHGDVETVQFAVVTISSSRSLDDDSAGDAIVAAVEATDDEVMIRDLIRDDYDGIQETVGYLADRQDVDCVVTTGGTGVTPDDVTVEAVEPLFDKRLPGFGELFRGLSREEIGTRVINTRATAGIIDGTPVFCLPGSENAARLGTTEIITAEAGHLAGLAATPDEE